MAAQEPRFRLPKIVRVRDKYQDSELQSEERQQKIKSQNQSKHLQLLINIVN